MYIHLYHYCFSSRIWFIYYIWTFFGFLYEDMRVHKCIWIQTERTISPNSQFIMCNPNWIATRRLLASIWIDAFDPKTHFQPKKRILKGTERLSFPSHKNTYINVTKNNYYTNIFCAISTSMNCIRKNIILFRITAMVRMYMFFFC